MRPSKPEIRNCAAIRRMGVHYCAQARRCGVGVGVGHCRRRVGATPVNAQAAWEPWGAYGRIVQDCVEAAAWPVVGDKCKELRLDTRAKALDHVRVR